MNMPDNITHRFRGIWETIEPLQKEYGQISSIQSVEDVFNRISSNQTTIMVCGEFKKGKSSFINALLNENLCPTDEHIATSTVSLIRYGNERKIMRTYDTQDGIKTEEIKFDALVQYAKGSNLSIGNTLLLEIEIPNDRLKNGLTLIDTPGVGGLNPQHRFLTLSALSKADALFYVVAVGEPTTTIELEFFKNEILPHSKHNKVILNKVDQIDEDEIANAILDCKKKFKQECGVKDIDVLPVSAYLWQESNISEDEDDRELSFCEGIEQALNDICIEYRDSLHPLLKNVMSQSINGLRNIINQQISQIEDPNPEKIKNLSNQRKVLEEMISDLKQDKSEIKRKIESTLKDVQTEVLNDIVKGNILLSTDALNSILKDDRALSDDGEKWVLNEIDKATKKLISKVDVKIEHGFATVIKLLGSSISKNNQVKQTSQFKYSYSKPNSTIIYSNGISDDIMTCIKHSLPAYGIGSLVSLVAGPWVGVVVGAAFLYKSLQGGNKNIKLAEIRQHLSPRISMMSTDLQTYVNKRFDDFRIGIINHFEKKAKDFSAQLDKIMKDTQKCRMDSASINEYKKELETKVKVLENANGQLQVLLTNPFAKKQ